MQFLPIAENMREALDLHFPAGPETEVRHSAAYHSAAYPIPTRDGGVPLAVGPLPFDWDSTIVVGN